MKIKFLGTGSYLPEQIITNEYLSTVVDTSDEWIYSRTGIKERRVAKDETTSYMAAAAAKRAIEDSGMDVCEIDLIVAASMTTDNYTPSLACQVQGEIGAINAAAFDLNAACTGFVFALNTVYAYLKAGIYKNALIIGAEGMSKIIDWTDRATCVLFGDGAGAVVVEARADEKGLFQMVQQTNGTKGNVLVCGNRSGSNLHEKTTPKYDYLYMDGQEVFKFVAKKVPGCITEVLEKTDLSLDDIKYFVLHQANKKILQSVARRLHITEDRFPMNIDKCGNTSAASIPLLLDQMNKDHMLEDGDKLIVSGFGGGLTWGATLFEW